MFERFSEKARDVIFLARYEASILGSDAIESEHLLLVLLKADQILRDQLPRGAAEAIRGQIESLPHPERGVPASVDIPLGHESKRVLAYSAEETERLGHQIIDCGHLTLGLLRNEGVPRNLLQEYGINAQSYRLILGTRGATAPPEPFPSAAFWMADRIANLENMVGRAQKHLKRYADVYGEQPLSGKPWTRKQALGHQVDWAGAHQVIFARALTEPRVVAGAYPADNWVPAQNYADYAWQEIVDLWVGLNGLLMHVLAQIPEDRSELPCFIGTPVGTQEPIPLSKLMDRYVEHCQDERRYILA